MNELSKKQLRNISTVEVRNNFYKSYLMDEPEYEDRIERLIENVGRVISCGKISNYELGENHINAYSYNFNEYINEGEDHFFYEYCDHAQISKNITEDSSYEDFHKYIDYEKLGEYLLLSSEGFCGEYFYKVDDYIFEVVDYDWLSEAFTEENTHEVIVICYETVNMYLDQNNDFEDAIRLAKEKLNGEVA